MADQEDKDNAYTQLQEETGSRLKRGCMVTFLGWFVAIAFLYLSKPIGKSLDADLSWLELLSWALLIFICPVFGILYGMDLKDHLDWQAKRSGSSIWFRFLILLGCWLLAAVVASMGAMMLYSAFYPSKTFNTDNLLGNQILVGIVSIIFLWATWELLKFPFRKYKGVTKAEEQAAWERWNQRMKNPDFLGIEAAGEMHLPFEFKIMFRADSEWQTKDWMLYPLGLNNNTEQHMILGLEPADTESLWRRWNTDTESEDLFLRFASCEDGYYYLKIEKGNNDPAVYEVFSDYGYSLTGELPPDVKPEKIADHFSQFISWPKEAI